MSEVRKPEKRILNKEPLAYLQYDKGYNHCYSEWEAYHNQVMRRLPDEGEIIKTMDCLGYEGLGTKLTSKEIETIAKAISKRIGK